MRGSPERMFWRTFWPRLVVLAGACLAVAIPIGCGSDDKPLPATGGAGTGGGGGVGGGLSGSCPTEGETKPCGVTLGQHDGVLSCYEGTQTCVGGEWSTCGDGEVVNKPAPPDRPDSPSSNTQALGPSQTCINNPCDPYCEQYGEQPDSGVVADAGGPLYTWPGGSLGDQPPGLINKGLKEPCKSGYDCQFNEYCTEPATSAACEHSKCATGGGLTATCDPCVEMICASNPSCCGGAYTSTCSHNPCSTGGDLKSNCDPCVGQICAVDPFCCNSSWDSICVGEVSSVCGKSCPLTGTGNWTQTCVNAVQSVCGAKCATAPPAPAACSHNVCSTGSALTAGCHSCVDTICGVDSFCCNNSWDSICVGEVASECGLGCPVNMTPQQPAPPESGECKAWLPGETDPACTGIDVSMGVPCDDTFPVCNHGQTTAPSGIKIISFSANSNQYPKCSPDQSKVKATCTTSAPIPPGQCISVNCPAIDNLQEVMINPPGAGHVNECSCLDNWTLYKKGTTCGLPTCAGDVETATFKPVNLYFMVDKSGSMGGNKWTGATAALKGFFQDPGSAGIGAALEFFPLGSGGIYGDGCPNGCNAGACANPMVPLATKLVAAGAPTDTQEQALVNGINAVGPGGLTPTHPALDGALTWAVNNQTSNPNEQYVVVLVTDGDPTQCDTNNSNIALLAATAFANNGIRTYTIGMEGANIAALDQIAQSGGSGTAFVIQGTNSNNVEAQLIAAFQAIAGQNVSCSFSLPPTGTFDVNDVTITYTPSAGTPVTTLPKRTSSAGCGTGWYFDNNTNPTTITLCPSTCATAQGDPGAKVDYAVGCPKVLATTKYNQIYEANCPLGSKPQWGYFAYDSVDPGDSSIAFRARTADLQTGLSTATYKPLATAQSAPTDTQVCPLSGPSPCPVDLYIKLGTPDAKRRWLELEVTLNPTSNKLNTPTLNNWNITYSCPPGE